jgi:hypothetical protein
MKAYIVKKYVLVHDWAPHPVTTTITVLDFVSQVHNAILMNVYLEVRNPGGLGFWNEGYMGKGREMKSSVYKQPETKVDGSCHS